MNTPEKRRGERSPDGKFTSAQVDEALELANEKLRLRLRFCEDVAQLWKVAGLASSVPKGWVQIYGHHGQ